MVTSSEVAFRGTPVVPGIAYGPALLVRTEVSPAAIAQFDPAAYDDADTALAAYDAAAQAVAEGFVRKAEGASGAAARKHLRSDLDVLAAVRAGVEQFVTIFTGMGGLMAERVTDLQDIERRIVAQLVGEPEPGVGVPEVPSVLVAEDLAPADTAGLDPVLVLALVTERGGPTSHTAIIARQLGIPCVVGVAGAMTVAGGTSLLVDGVAGTIETDPDAAAAAGRVAADAAARSALASWS